MTLKDNNAENMKEKKAKMIGDSSVKFQPISNYDEQMESVRKHANGWQR